MREPGFRITDSFWPFLIGGVVLLGYVAQVTHSLGIDRQPDSHIISQTLQFMDAAAGGHLLEFLLNVRKYPLFPSLILAPLYGVQFLLLALFDGMRSMEALQRMLFLSPGAFYLLNRAVIGGFALWICLLLASIHRLIRPQKEYRYGMLLLGSSVLFWTFATAVRPHMLVAAFTLWSFERAIILSKEKSFRNELLAAIAATAAFCSLQNGIFAFLFPIWGIAYGNGRFQWRQLLQWRIVGWGAACALTASILGYPFLWNRFFDPSASVGLDLGHNIFSSLEHPWNGNGFLVLGRTLLGSELLLFLPALVGLALLLRRRVPRFHGAAPVLLFLALYLLIFGLYTDTQPRYFVILLPFLAILGSIALEQYRALRAIAVGITLIVAVQFARLGITPNTYALAGAFVQGTSGVIDSSYPHYLLGIPPTRASITSPSMAREAFLLSLAEDLPQARQYTEDLTQADIVLRGATEPRPDPTHFSPCYDATAFADARDASVFLWSESPYGFFWLWKAARMGPNIAVYCRYAREL